jgi:hypothetical protein
MKTSITRFLSFTAAACAVVLFSHLSADAASITLPATNQTVCYDTAGALINCTGTRQDGALRMGASWPVQRFSDNGDGTFTDNLTGLVWMSDNTCLLTATYNTFVKALDAVANLADGQCGLTDGSVKGAWRMPNVNEAYSLFDSSKKAIAAGTPFKLGSGYNNSVVTSTTYKKNTDYLFYISIDSTLSYVIKSNINPSLSIPNIKAVRNP